MMKHSPRVGPLEVAALALFPVAACSDGGASPSMGSTEGIDPATAGTFIAFEPAFEEWRTWEKFLLGDGSALGQAHLAGPRGGDYDAPSAPGWEWFELHNDPDGSMGGIVWRGFGPPAGEEYGGDTDGCASCPAGGNDFVPGAALALSNL